MSLKYFKAREFKCPDGTERCMAPEFLSQLDAAREFAGVPFKLTSAFRTPEYNESVGGSENSSHLRGVAVDIAASDSRTRFRIVFGLVKAGFTRIGVGEDFIHVDMDTSKDQEVMWLY